MTSLIDNFKLLISANQLKAKDIDTKVKHLVEEVLESSLNANVRYLEKLNKGSCSMALNFKKVIKKEEEIIPETETIEVKDPSLKNKIESKKNE